MALNIPPEELDEDGLPTREPLRVRRIEGPSWYEFVESEDGLNHDFTFHLSRQVTTFEKNIPVARVHEWERFDINYDRLMIRTSVAWVDANLNDVQRLVQTLDEHGRAAELTALQKFAQMEERVRAWDEELPSYVPMD